VWKIDFEENKAYNEIFREKLDRVNGCVMGAFFGDCSGSTFDYKD
jgi:hypothetical protein